MDKPAEKVLTGVKKRTQIESTNKNIFVWLAVASVVVSFSLVALQFLFKEAFFNQDVISAKNLANKTLKENVETGKELTKNVNALLANTDLASVQKDETNAKSTTLNIVLDALPTSGDSTSFASSLQNTVFIRSGVAVRELSTVVETAPAAGDGAAAPLPVEGSSDQPLTLPFEAGLKGTYAEIQAALAGLNASIRPISPTKLSILSSDDGKLQVEVAGVTYYLPAKNVEIRTEVKRP